QGQPIDRLLPLPGLDETIQELRHTGQPFSDLEYTVDHSADQVNANKTFSVSGSKIQPANADTHQHRQQRFLLIINDITERKHAEQELIRQAGRAEQSSRLKTEFLANMSHEIRTPMNGILGFADLLAMEDLTDQQEEWVNVIHTCGQNLLMLIDDILDISRIEANELRIEPCQFGISDMLTDIQRTTAPGIEAQGLSFSLEMTEDMPTTVNSDPQRLRQILTNLLTNAQKFTQDGRITLRARADLLDEVPAVRFEIIDTGIGIPAEHHETIFNVFRQADSSTSRKYGGNGLGLAICKRLTYRLGGRIWVNSAPSKGSTFVVVIPLQIPIPQSTDQAASSPSDSVSPVQPGGILQLSGRILLAEDNQVNRDLLRIILERVGLQVDHAEDGRKAVELASSREYDLILMDLQMPCLDGMEATRILRNKGLTTPVIALTAHAMVHEQEQCLRDGFDGVLPKPVNQGTLLATIQQHLSAAAPLTSEP
ncbi:MAG: response regulator, partial [Actinobacteria bacterium]|nr:response regulator [Actinomycetota bacterium]